ncbi:MAG: conjugal transfer protein TraG [Gammaproteobacteria bacterium]|nr:conjugal transfer protein TraG [Gammaproteobacteria bacterium]
MRVFSYLELHTTLIAWQLYNVLYDVITQTGLVLVPLAWSLVRITAQAIGEDRGDGHEAPVGNLKAVLQMALVILFCLVPIYTVSPSAISFEPPSGPGKSPGEVTAETDPTTYGDIIPSAPTGGATQVPGWWALLHAISTGVANAVMQSLPEYTDLRELKTQMTALNIHDSALAGEYSRFLNTCYYPAKQNYHRLRQEGSIPAPDQDDALDSVDWAGSHYLYEMEGGYRPCTGEKDCRGAPHYLDPPLPDLVGADTCRGWWDLLRTRIFQQANTDSINAGDTGHIDDAIAGLTVGPYVYKGGNRDREDIMIRKTLENHEMRLAASPDSTQRDPSFWGNIVQGARNVATLAGGAAVWFTLEIVLGIIQQALPILIAILLMFLITMIPLVLLFTGFRIDPVIRISFLVFSAIFLHALLAIADWLDYYLTVSLFEGQVHAWLAADDRTFGHAQKRMLINIVLLMNYIALPMLWFKVMGAVGLEAGRAGSGLMDETGAKTIGGQVADRAGSSMTNPTGVGFVKGVAKAGGNAVKKFRH